MTLKDQPIRRKLMTVILVTSGAVLLLTCAAFGVSEWITFRHGLVQNLSTLARIAADNSTATLAFENETDAKTVLAAFRIERNVVAAGLYDSDGKLFAAYPTNEPAAAFPAAPGKDGYRFAQSHLILFQPVVEDGNRLGTLYLKSDVSAMYERFRLYAGIVVIVVVVSFLVALAISTILQKRISGPILALADTARAISSRKDYSVRARKVGEDELGLLTDAFNQMLNHIQERDLALRSEEARKGAILESAQDGIIGMDHKGHILEFNPAAQRIFGYTRDQAIGREIAELIIPAALREKHRRGLAHYLATGEGPALGRLLELTALRADGTEFPVELSITRIASEEPATFTGFARDITERKRVQAELEQRRTELQFIFDTVPAFIFYKDREHRNIRVNQALQRALGIPKEAIEGRTDKEMGSPHADHYIQDDDEVMTSGQAKRGIIEPLQTASGTRWLETDKFPYRDETGRIVGLIGFAVDVTERKRAEEAIKLLAAIVESSEDAIIGKTLEGIVTSWNKGAERLFGYSADEMLGRSITRIAPPDRLDEESLILSRVRGGEPVEHYETVRVCKDGRAIDVSLTVSPVRDGNGRIVGASKIARDITERKRAEEEIHRLNEELERRVVERTIQLEAANKELEAFTYSVSHDLRSPLRGIAGYAQILLEDSHDKLDDEGKRSLGVIQGETGRMGRLIDELLNFSRLGRQQLKCSTLDMTALATAVFDELASLPADRKPRLELRPLPPAWGDAALMRQVFVNLLSNAVKFTRYQEAPVIQIGGQSDTEQNTYYVKDNGAGFDPKYSNKLFGVFQRLHRDDEFEGTGVGLALVQRIIQRHGGRIWGESRPNEGATFHFTLPK